MTLKRGITVAVLSLTGVLAVTAAALTTVCILRGRSEAEDEQIWTEIAPAAEAEFGEPLRDDGTYLSETIHEPEPDPYADDTEFLSKGITPEGVEYYLYNKHAEITGHTADFQAETLEIPAELEGKPVTRIAGAETTEENRFELSGGAFCNCYTLRSITLPECLTEIGAYAFYDCKNLRDITIPERVTVIGQRAFAMCSSLKTLTVPIAIGEIGQDAFSLTPWYDGLLFNRDLIIFNGILYDVGRHCRGDVVIPEYVTRISDFAFFCTPGVDSVVIPESCQSIGEMAFSTCHELRDVVIRNPEIEIAQSEKTFSNKPEGGNLDYFWGTFIAEKGSTAEQYAKKYKFEFMTPEEAADTPRAHS
ncbi:MAG TPA: hypothetical protein DDX71_07960 [Ruminococcus sp.]|nr:hypothetical protein [Ruminococcus sp.]